MSIPSHPFELAAFATAAVPGMRVVEIHSPSWNLPTGSLTSITDDRGNHWIVEAPALEFSEEELASLQNMLSLLCDASESEKLTFTVPRPAGIAPADSSFVAVSAAPGGMPGSDDEAITDVLFASSLGRALASLHNLDVMRSAQTGAVVLSNRALRNRVREWVSRGGSRIPPPLRRRWLGAADHDQLWTFSPTVIHGDLGANNVWSADGAVLALSGFWNARVSDPAEDIAWLLPLASDAVIEEFYRAYGSAIATPDLHLMTRAQLYSELALVKWLLHGMETADAAVIEQAEQMIAELNAGLDGQFLVEPNDAVAPIDFSPEEEPLIRLHAPTDAQTGADTTTMDLIDQLSSYEYPPEDRTDLATEDLSAVIEDIVADHTEEAD